MKLGEKKEKWIWKTSLLEKLLSDMRDNLIRDDILGNHGHWFLM